MKKMLMAAGAFIMLAAGQANAYWSTTDVTEAYGVLPNHSAFWIPGMGDSKSNQVQMESEDFLKANKVQAKFFIIPHTKLVGSTYMGWDKYIPVGRLIIVDRTPFFHEWTKKGRGTSIDKDSSFPCHSMDNIEVSAEMSLAAEVKEDDAAKYLFYFGVNQPAGDESDPNVIFTSMFQGKKLEQVMNGWGRGEIQSRVCREINLHTVEDLGKNGNTILDDIQRDAKAFFSLHGITIEYVGWAGGFDYPPEVKQAINTRFAAEHIRPVLDILERKAVIDALNGWDHKLPQTLVINNGDSPIGAIIAGIKSAGGNVTKPIALPAPVPAQAPPAAAKKEGEH